MTAYRHVVLFRIHDDVPESEVERALGTLTAAGRHDGVLSWRIARSEDDRKGRILVENGLFRRPGGLRALAA